MDQLALLERRITRERKARQQAELLLERKSRELYEANQELRRVADELREQNAQTQAILDAAAEAVLTVDDGGRILSFNKAAGEIFGYTPAEAVGRDITSLLADHSRVNPPESVGQVLAPAVTMDRGPTVKAGASTCPTGGLFRPNPEVTGVRKDGSTLLMECSVSRVCLEERHVCVVLARDVTKRRRAEQALLEEARLARLRADVGLALANTSSMQDMLSLCMESIVRHLGAAFARIWTLNATENVLEMQASAGMYTHIDGPHGRVPVGTLKIGLIAEQRTPHITNDVLIDPRIGDPAWARREGMVAFAGHPLLVGDRLVGVMAMFARTALSHAVLGSLGTIAHGIALGIDRHWSRQERDRLQRQLVEASRRAGMAEIATGVLHNVGNVLNSVGVAASLAIEKTSASKTGMLVKVAEMLDKPPAELAEFFNRDEKGKQLPGYLKKLAGTLMVEQSGVLRELQVLSESTEHLRAIVAAQQSYAGAAGMMEEGDVAELMNGALEVVDASLGRHGIQVIRDFDACPPIQVEKHKLSQILVNLISNAKHALIDAGRDDSRLTVRIPQSVGGRVRIEVIDNGVGIPAENLTKIFSYGFSTRKDGHGFGLHHSALAAQEMGGSLTAQSDGAGQGATFSLELPVVPAEVSV